jgi:DNA primase
MTNWVSFSGIKASTDLAGVLRQYGVDWLRRSGPQPYRGRCPIHRGEGEDAFHANLERDLFQCFACGKRGNVLDFVAAMENSSIREAALRLQRSKDSSARDTDHPGPQWRSDPEAKLVTKKREVNAPLTFQLAVNSRHPYLAKRGIEAGTAARFGIGWYGGPGLMHNRIAIPIHDSNGRLVAYCGRALEEGAPRYRFPAGFQKSRELFNYHRAVVSHWEAVIVVEGFFDCMRVHQAGYGSVVALMGSVLSAGQKELLCQDFRRVVLLLDGDETGRAATLRIGPQLRPTAAVTEIFLPTGVQPDQLSKDELRRILERPEGRAGTAAN